MSDPDSRTHWRNYSAPAIPTKGDFGALAAWLQLLAAEPRILDLGCGVGSVSAWLQRRGCRVMGVDINSEAIELARLGTPDEEFAVADIAAKGGLESCGGRYDGVVCQLVISIVGDTEDRRQLLRNAQAVLRPGGWLYLSASGVSDDLNAVYARLYSADFALTGERHTYLSRDAEGRVLYRTHHFTEDELHALLQDAGYRDIAITGQIEASSRRPDQRARFFYAAAQRAPGQE
jgi:2-polyprenyl-3-methyl-5-hydroxy-6-metoxy-1,4-benzoquinol methylase